jgi:site-specific DNA-methyltransferase (adenine-specific)
MNIDLKHGDCLQVLKDLPDNSVDSIVTDPPYGLKFMSKKWDYDVPSVEIWKECLRVLKPGGHLLSFSGSRTYHRMAVRIEDAGFEIRDQIMWIYGSGFPKGKSQLKPAHEPIVMARKPGPIIPLNIDDCRIEYKDDKPHSVSTIRENEGNSWNKDYNSRTEDWVPNNTGRWPANIIFDEGEEPWRKYFYCPKASKKDRDENNNHPTVKPTDLMLYLIKLVTPKDGIVLDPFMGSGSTGKAAIRGGYNFIGIEREEEYIKISEARINYERNHHTN